ncbi:MAG: arginine--tRNA ligase [Bacteroidales bacterium]|nr:arginine--tRNA ligase [Bacteroidales bacterium]
MNIESRISAKVQKALVRLYDTEISPDKIQIQRTRKDFTGDFTVVVFPFLRFSKLPPEQTGEEIGNFLKDQLDEISGFNVIKGFLNLTIDNTFWVRFLNSMNQRDHIYDLYTEPSNRKIVVEYSSPNTNKPLHLGHIRNNLLGFSVSRILQATGHQVRKVNLVNDRGIHICKSMLAWQKWGEEETPATRGIKGDHLVGDYYVRFEQEYKKQVADLIAKGKSKEEAEKEAPIIQEARELLNRWEKDDPETMELWKKMNGWVLEGFNETYQALGIDFDKVYYESEVYKLGREEVKKGLDQGIFFAQQDGSVWADLAEKDLDQKLLLRSDGTSVYITQDIGTAIQRYREFEFDEHIYVVGNEQNYHFQVLKILLDKLGYSWAEHLHHLAYGMVELPEGKMKSREGTVVDADDLIREMLATAGQMTEESGKVGNFSEEEQKKIYRSIGLGALKYFILKVDPKKNMTFDPRESVDFNGNTGPFIQYSYARINSLLSKAAERSISIPREINIHNNLNDKEIQLIKLIHQFPSILAEAAEEMNPAEVANFIYELAREFNQFYHDHSVLSAESKEVVQLRILLSVQVSRVIREAMWLLGIDLPERM